MNLLKTIGDAYFAAMSWLSGTPEGKVNLSLRSFGARSALTAVVRMVPGTQAMGDAEQTGKAVAKLAGFSNSHDGIYPIADMFFLENVIKGGGLPAINKIRDDWMERLSKNRLAFQAADTELRENLRCLPGNGKLEDYLSNNLFVTETIFSRYALGSKIKRPEMKELTVSQLLAILPTPDELTTTVKGHLDIYEQSAREGLWKAQKYLHPFQRAGRKVPEHILDQIASVVRADEKSFAEKEGKLIRGIEGILTQKDQKPSIEKKARVTLFDLTFIQNNETDVSYTSVIISPDEAERVQRTFAVLLSLAGKETGEYPIFRIPPSGRGSEKQEGYLEISTSDIYLIRRFLPQARTMANSGQELGVLPGVLSTLDYFGQEQQVERTKALGRDMRSMMR